jgi:hypothetical protein
LFRLHSGHFSKLVTPPLLGTRTRLVGWMLAGTGVVSPDVV